MSGILKDILLVLASMLFFRDPVTGQQFIGYSIALAGLVYYKLGSDTLHSIVIEGTLKFNAIRQNHPAQLRYAVLVGLLSLIVVAFLLLSGPSS